MAHDVALETESYLCAVRLVFMRGEFAQEE